MTVNFNRNYETIRRESLHVIWNIFEYLCQNVTETPYKLSQLNTKWMHILA